MLKDKREVKKALLAKLPASRAGDFASATTWEQLNAVGGVLQDYVKVNWQQTGHRYVDHGAKQAYYFSMEFLPGRFLRTNLINLGLRALFAQTLKEMGVELSVLEEQEPDPGLGNGGLGRLAACLLDSLAALGFPAHGCGMRYKYGFFEQRIVEGYQVELPDNWLEHEASWETRKPEQAVQIRFGGTVHQSREGDRFVFQYENTETVTAVPYDVPIVGYHNKTVNTLRLWNAEPNWDEVDFSVMGREAYQQDVSYKSRVESISEVLYPDDTFHEGRVLRLKQEYFLVSAGLQSIIRHIKQQGWSLNELADKVAVHINDTHPVLAVPELMRILTDEEGIGWDEAWIITTNTISYTNHTIMPEAMEKWPIDIFKALLPRIYMIVHEINERFCRLLWEQYPGEWDRIANMAIIADGHVKMAHLAVVGSYSVNGVAPLHTQILRKEILQLFYQLSPHKFTNRTNGITHRRWLLNCNPQLAALITATIGSSWIRHPKDLAALEAYASDGSFCQKFQAVKQTNKLRLAQFVRDRQGITLDLASVFDVQIKRIHSYKRQLLNILHIMHLYNQLKDDPGLDMVPRTFFFAGKAAPTYYLAKRTIKLINAVASVVNCDPVVRDRLKVIFLENYGVSAAELIIPATDVSEQISTAGKEASGTSNMKFMLNGAVTIGTMDGANIEIYKEVGDDNFMMFGLRSEEVARYYKIGGYRSRDVYETDARVRRVLDQLVDGTLPIPEEEARHLYNSLLDYNDEFFVLKDFSAYAAAQQRIDSLYRDQCRWTEMCAHNIAHAGRFSSDCTVQEYAIGTWDIQPVPAIGRKEGSHGARVVDS